MESCNFIKLDENGDRYRCGSRYETKEVEFRHPDYKDLNKRIFICQAHFNQVFGEYVATKESIKPLDQDKYLELCVRNEEKHYRDHIKDVRKKVRDGIGYDSFDWDLFYQNAGRKLRLAKERLRILRRSICRYEFCNQKLTNFRKMYTIRVFPKKQTEYVNLFFCSLDHWEVYKKRVGLTDLIGKLKEGVKKKASYTLDQYTEMV